MAALTIVHGFYNICFIRKNRSEENTGRLKPLFRRPLQAESCPIVLFAPAIFCFTVKHGKIRAQHNIILRQNSIEINGVVRSQIKNIDAITTILPFTHCKDHEKNTLTPFPACRVRSGSR